MHYVTYKTRLVCALNHDDDDDDDDAGFLLAGCVSCYQTNSVKALKETQSTAPKIKNTTPFKPCPRSTFAYATL